MAYILDLVGSAVVRAAIILIILSMTVTLNSALYNKTAFANTKSTLEVSANIMFQDIRLAGYNVSLPAFDIADTKSMKFHTDIKNKGSNDILYYYGTYKVDTLWYSGAVAITDTTWKINRTLNGGSALVVANNLRSYLFQYLDVNGNYTTTLSDIKGITVKLDARVGISAASTGISNSLADTTATKEFRVYPVSL